ncbi:MAG TPA: hypothetical protein VFW52_02300 [Candidatus Saccharimonadales bacterium]|nr:hypothetical protein [Candidatus Saccharimonadales bacterium]
MELSNEHKDRLKRVLIAGSAAVAAGVIVKYVHDYEGDLKGFIYRFKDGVKTGIYRDGDKLDIVQISGSTDGAEEPVFDPRIVEQDIESFEYLVSLAEQSQE